jgi:hypothetical protein
MSEVGDLTYSDRSFPRVVHFSSTCLEPHATTFCFIHLHIYRGPGHVW